MSLHTSRDVIHSTLVLALRAQPSVGNVTIHRLLTVIPSPEMLEHFPREQLMIG